MFSKKVLNNRECETVTYLQSKRGERAVKLALNFSGDGHISIRIAEGKCKVCYYLQAGAIAGQGFTQFMCALCNRGCLSATTNCDALCKECASKNGLCVHCGADIHLDTRRKFDLQQEL